VSSDGQTQTEPPRQSQAGPFGNVLAPTGPHGVEGGWQRRRPLLRRALLAATIGAVTGLAGAKPPAPR
jgi:hypothetical protein